MNLSSILVTGSNGFVGKSLIRDLLSQNVKITGLDLTETVPTGLNAFHHGSVLDQAQVTQAVRGNQAIIHLAAAHKDFGVSDQTYWDVNVGGTENLLTAARQEGVNVFVFFSSVAVYGAHGETATSENSPTSPTSPYGKSKLGAEAAVRRWAKEDAKRTALILRPVNIFGPENRHNLFRLIAALDNKHFVRVGRLDKVKSIVFVENVVAATRFLMGTVTPGTHTFNLSDEPSLASWDLIQLICRTAGFSPPQLMIPQSVVYPVGAILDLAAAVSGRDLPITGQRIRKLNTASHFSADQLRAAGFTAPFTLEQGLRTTLDWYKSIQDEKKAA